MKFKILNTIEMRNVNKIMIIVLIIFMSCSQDDNIPNNIINNEPIAFLLYNTSKDSYAYYYNEKIVPLASLNGDIISKSISLSNSTVYIGGSQKINNVWNPAIWTNGVLETQTPTFDSSYYIESIWAQKGSVYTAGRRSLGNNIIATTLKDNIKSDLSMTKNYSVASRIRVSESIVAVAGRQTTIASHGNNINSPAVWENGILFELPLPANGTSGLTYCVYNNDSKPLYGGYSEINGKWVPTLWNKKDILQTIDLPENKSGVVQDVINFKGDIYTLIKAFKLENGAYVRTIELWKDDEIVETLVTSNQAVFEISFTVVGDQLVYGGRSNTEVIIKTLQGNYEIPETIRNSAYSVLDISSQ